ncbi:ATP-binding protein [Novosphingobium terrae]|uniref:ATP-binding protein n=1 Tax=Novosphingobium terrae TaxID=2726189 RepID=UPI0019824DEF|nr:ATP-binding protein [Novosphingobium terrae]
MSIRRRLLLWLLACLLGVSCVFIAATYLIERVGIEHHQDQRLRRIAQDIPDSLKPDDLRSFNVKLFHGRDDFLLQIWQGDREIYRSTVDRELPRGLQPGFGLRTVRGEVWKVFVRQTGLYTIQVAQSLDERNALAQERALHLIVPLILLIGAIALCTPIGVNAGLRSLRRISSELETRNLDRLIPLNPRDEPEEILPVIEAINTLLERLGRAAVSQQQFLADASHELRTPLAGLQLQVKMVEQAPDQPARHEALAAVTASVKRAGRLVDQLLTTSRLDADLPVERRETVSLNLVAREAVMRLAPIAEVRRIDLGLVHDLSAVVSGTHHELMLLTVNLIDNAIRYTPEGGQIDVAVLTQGAEARLVIEDSGPGIPLAERDRAFDRFYRGRGVAAAGSGLGLAIVKRIADRHAASVSLGDSASLGGLKVDVAFAPGEVCGMPPCIV